jgi:hypothetical protein
VASATLKTTRIVLLAAVATALQAAGAVAQDDARPRPADAGGTSRSGAAAPDAKSGGAQPADQPTGPPARLTYP